MKTPIFTIITVSLFFFAGGAQAARPLVTEDAGTVPPEEFEIEAGWDYMNPRCGDRESSAGLMLKSGLSPRLDLGIGVPYALEPDEGFEAAEIALKFALPHFSVCFSHCTGDSAYSFFGVVSRPLGPFAAHLNAGAEMEGAAGGDALFLYAAALEYELGGKFTLVAEVAGLDDEVTGLGGCRWAVLEKLVLDAGAGAGGGGDSDDDAELIATLGLTLLL